MSDSTEERPTLDMNHIVDMRGWVGEDSFQGLIESVPDSFQGELGKILSAWQAGDLKMVRDTGHRLKGSASSLGCADLAHVGFCLQHLPDSGLEEGWRLDELRDKVQAALQALHEYAQTPPPEPQDDDWI